MLGYNLIRLNRTSPNRFCPLLGIVLIERMEDRSRVNTPPGTYFHTDFNEPLFVLIALTLMEISVDCNCN